jgi:hypothetical protein
MGWHCSGWVDPQRVWLANIKIGYVGGPFTGLFGDPKATPYLWQD